MKETILRRKEACRQHRKYNRLREAFPEVISREKVEEKWVAYLEMKQVAKDLVAKKRLRERDEVLREFRNSGGYGSSYSWKKVKKGVVKGVKRLRDAAGKVVAEDCEMAAIAKHHFEKNSRQTVEIATEEGMNFDSPHRERLNQEQVERLGKPSSYIEVVEAVKRMKRGKGWEWIKLVRRC